MPDFLLELLSEEIPARMQGKAREDLTRLFADEVGKAGLTAAALETYATPRRLVLIARGLPEATEAVSEELKGPRASAPPQALDGFLRKTGLNAEHLEERDGILFARLEKPGRAARDVLAEALPAILRAFPWPKSMRWGETSLSTESPRWVRPLQGIIALLGEEIVEFDFAGIRSGAATLGHRFHHPGPITVGSANDYAEKLRACHVVVDQEERARLIGEGAAAAASAAGLILVEDEGLVAENAGLTEWPVPLLGRFDPAFLEVPREVIQLTMRTNQKYFALLAPPRDGEGGHAEHGGGGAVPGSEPPPSALRAATSPSRGGLAPAFICTANIEASDGGGAIVAGNERVLSARLADAKFFWEQDLKTPLEEQAQKLGGIVFHEKLGTIADKVERVAKLARWLVEEGIVGGSSHSSATISARPERSRGAPARTPHIRPSTTLGTSETGNLAEMAERAARLCKADLVTGLVGEFPELQGVIGAHLARAQGEPDAVADAIRDHYKPVGQGDEVPTEPITVAVSLADKIDTLATFFMEGMPPTGSKDPFALRRSALAALSQIAVNELRFGITSALGHAASTLWDQQGEGALNLEYEKRYPEVSKDFARVMAIRESIASGALRADELTSSDIIELTPERDVLEFLIDRLKVQQREAGVRHDLIDAVFSLGEEDDLVRLLARVKALQAFVETPEGKDLLAGYKRAANILKREDWQGRGHNSLSYTPLPEEEALIDALDAAEPKARAAVEAEEFERAMAALASLRAPVDAFFDKVIVNDPDPAKREARLALLARMRDAVHQVADFSRIEG